MIDYSTPKVCDCASVYHVFEKYPAPQFNTGAGLYAQVGVLVSPNFCFNDLPRFEVITITLLMSHSS